MSISVTAARTHILRSQNYVEASVLEILAFYELLTRHFDDQKLDSG